MDKPSLVGSYVGLSVPMMMGLVLMLVVVGAGGSAPPTTAFAASPSSHSVSGPSGLQSATEGETK